MTLRRRAVLSGMAAASVWVSGTGPALPVVGSVQGSEALGRRLAAILHHPDSFAALGTRVAAQYRAPSMWSDRRTPLGPGLAALQRLDDRALLTLVQRRIAEDLSFGRMVEVDGWVLAQSEAVIAGILSAILNGRRA